MKTIEHVQGENMKLLVEIYQLRIILNKLYSQKGPANSDYISLSIKLDLLIKEYIEEKISVLREEFMEV